MKIKVFEAFAGYGSQRMALRNLGIEHEVVAISEFDKYADASYQAIHGETWNMGDITKIDVDDVPDHDLFTYSFPCFTKDNLVLTEEGYKPINEVTVGDKVLTHNNTYEKVVKTFDNGIQPTVKVKAMGIDEIVTTPNHKFYVREKYREWNNDRRSYNRLFKEPQWKEIKDVTKDYYLGMAVNQKSEIPKWNGITFHWSDGRKPRHKNELQELMDNQYFWWIVGRYLADGWTRTQGGIAFGIGKNKASEFENRLGELFNYSTAEEKSVVKYHVPLKELSKFVEQFGKGAANKKLSKSVLNLPIDLLESFLEGYFSGDGSFVNGYWKANSVSRELMLGIGQAVMKVYKRPYSLYKDIRPKTTVIEGRTVNQKDTYSLSFKKESKKQDNAFYEDGYVWAPFNTIEDTGNENVYDIEVNNAHSFTVQNVIVHNCQDISVAGKGKGFSKDSGTRSGLLWESERIIKAKKPKYLLMENVKNLISEKFMPGFVEWILALEELGYSNYYEVLNAKDFGIPQNRERVFMVSILGEHEPYVFPKPIKLEKRLKDVLEDEVDEKYYLNNEKTEQLIATITEENNITNPTVVDASVNEPKTKEIMNTITARYDAGIQNYKSMGGAVIEPEIKQVGNTTPNPKRENPQTGRTYDADGLAPTLNTMQGGNRQPQIVEPTVKKVDITQKVIVRKHKVDTRKLVQTLRNHKKTTNREIAEKLGRPITQVEHWFRTDDSFSIPDSDIWYELKELLEIKTDEFDKPITEFIEEDGVYEKAERHYFTDGIAPTLTSTSADEKNIERQPIIAASRGRGKNNEQQLEVNKDDTSNALTTVEKDNYVLEGVDVHPFSKKLEFQGYKQKEISPCLLATDYKAPKTVLEKEYIGTLASGASEEFGVGYMEGLSKTLKANKHDISVLEGIPIINNTKKGYLMATDGDGIDLAYAKQGKRRGRVQKDMAQTLTTDDSKGVVEQYRIRKLTPLECFRLMDVTDEDFYKAQAVNSNSQLYKQAGNSIVVSVLEAIFRNMFLEVPEEDLIGEHIPLF